MESINDLLRMGLPEIDRRIEALDAERAALDALRKLAQVKAGVYPLLIHGEIRKKVLDAIADWASTEKIMAETGLTNRQVRGVINAADLHEHTERRKIEGTRKFEFRYRPIPPFVST